MRACVRVRARVRVCGKDIDEQKLGIRLKEHGGALTESLCLRTTGAQLTLFCVCYGKTWLSSTSFIGNTSLLFVKSV